MDYIPLEIVTKTWQDMAQLKPEQAPVIVEQMKLEQPNLLDYLLSVDEEMFTAEERESIFYVGMVVWQIMRQSKYRLGKISVNKLLKAQKEGFDFLEILSEDTEADFINAAEEMIRRYPEPEVLRYIIETVMGGEEDLPEEGFRDDVKGMAAIHLKIALDAMIHSLIRK